MRCYSGMCAFVGYIFVTREHCEGRYSVACAPLTDGRVVGGGVWVTSLQHANKGMARYDVGCVRLWGYRIKAEHHVVLRFGLFIACLLK